LYQIFKNGVPIFENLDNFPVFENLVPDFRKSCLMQVATCYAISRGSFDETIGRVVIIRDDSPMDDPADNAQLWESVLTRK
jgi:hypothetical protein